MKTEVVKGRNPIYFKSYMLTSSYVSSLSIKVILYTNKSMLNKINHKFTKYFGQINFNLEEIMKNHKSKDKPLEILLKHNEN